MKKNIEKLVYIPPSFLIDIYIGFRNIEIKIKRLKASFVSIVLQTIFHKQQNKNRKIITSFVKPGLRPLGAKNY